MQRSHKPKKLATGPTYHELLSESLRKKIESEGWFLFRSDEQVTCFASQLKQHSEIGRSDAEDDTSGDMRIKAQEDPETCEGIVEQSSES